MSQETEHSLTFRNWTTRDEAHTLAKMLWTEIRASSKATADYWKIEGTTAIRVRVRPRRANFAPPLKTTYPGSDKDTDPWFDRLGHARTTLVRFKSDPNRTLELRDEWAHAMGHDEYWVATGSERPTSTTTLSVNHSIGKTSLPMVKIQWNTLGHHLAWNYPMINNCIIGQRMVLHG